MILLAGGFGVRDDAEDLPMMKERMYIHPGMADLYVTSPGAPDSKTVLTLGRCGFSFPAWHPLPFFQAKGMAILRGPKASSQHLSLMIVDKMCKSFRPRPPNAHVET